MAEDVLKSLLQGHFSSSHPQGPVSGETEAPGWDDLFMVTGANNWTGAVARRIAGSCGQHGEQGQDKGFSFPVTTKPLDADGRGAQEKHPRLGALIVLQERTFLTIMLSDFLAPYN